MDTGKDITLKEEGIEMSLENLLKNIERKIFENSGVCSVPPGIFVGKTKRKDLEQQFGKEIIEQYTKEGKIKWV